MVCVGSGLACVLVGGPNSLALRLVKLQNSETSRAVIGRVCISGVWIAWSLIQLNRSYFRDMVQHYKVCDSVGHDGVVVPAPGPDSAAVNPGRAGSKSEAQSDSEAGL